MAPKKNTSGNKPTKKTVKKTTAKNAVKKTSSKSPAKKAAKKASPKKAVTKKPAAKKSVKSPAKKAAVKYSPKKGIAKASATTQRSTKTESSSKSSGIAGKTFLFTGTLTGLQRKEAEALVKANGGIILSGVSDKLNYLIVGEDAGSKLDKAKKIKSIKVLSEKEFENMISTSKGSTTNKGNSPKKSLVNSPQDYFLLIDFEVMDEDDIEGDADEFWDNMEEDHSFIEDNLISKLPLYILSKGKLKIVGDYFMRYICKSDLDSKAFVEKHSDDLIAFCKNPETYYQGTISINLGQVIKKLDEKALLKDEDAFYESKLNNKYWITEFGVEEA